MIEQISEAATTSDNIIPDYILTTTSVNDTIQNLQTFQIRCQKLIFTNYVTNIKKSIQNETELPEEVRTKLTDGISKLLKYRKKIDVIGKLESINLSEQAKIFNGKFDIKAVKEPVSKLIEFIESIKAPLAAPIENLEKKTISTFFIHVLDKVPDKFVDIRSSSAAIIYLHEQLIKMLQLCLNIFKKLKP